MTSPKGEEGEGGPRLGFVTGDGFDRVVQDRSSPVVAAFTATWCAPCAWLKPYLYAIMTEAGPKARVVGVDVDEAPDVARRFGIRSVPTVLLLRDGVEVERSVGVEPDRLQEWMDVLCGEAT